MDKILLIIPDATLRQLYHELLFSKKTEIIATNTIVGGLLILTTTTVSIIVLYVDAYRVEIEQFLLLLMKRRRWRRIPIIILDSEQSISPQLLKGQDKIINPLLITPDKIAEEIKRSL